MYLLPAETTVTLAEGTNHINEKFHVAEDTATSQLAPTVNGNTKNSHVSFCIRIREVRGRVARD